jgi:hypothetical protein
LNYIPEFRGLEFDLSPQNGEFPGFRSNNGHIELCRMAVYGFLQHLETTGDATKYYYSISQDVDMVL